MSRGLAQFVQRGVRRKPLSRKHKVETFKAGRSRSHGVAALARRHDSENMGCLDARLLGPAHQRLQFHNAFRHSARSSPVMLAVWFGKLESTFALDRINPKIPVRYGTPCTVTVTSGATGPPAKPRPTYS